MSLNTGLGLASIIIPCFNQRLFSELCLRALFRHTRGPWELIVVDNGSTDDTAPYLAGVQVAAPVPVTIIRNAQNLGFPAGVNQGLQTARGKYLVLLNNDAVVNDGWLNQLIGLAEMETGPSSRDEADRVATRSTKGIGLVGPMSNYASPPQWIEEVPYRDLQEMESFAWRWRDEHRGEWFTTSKLSGFCLLMKRTLYEAIGGLDEQFGLGLFDDDDLAERGGGLDLSWQWLTISSSTILAAGRSPGMASMPRACWRRMRDGLRPNGARTCRLAAESTCAPGRIPIGRLSGRKGSEMRIRRKRGRTAPARTSDHRFPIPRS